MTSPFQKMIQVSFKTVQTLAGETATILRTFDEVVITITGVTVILGETRVEESVENDNIVVTSRIRDLLVEAADYVFDDGVGPVEPAVGDRFTLTLNGVAVVFEACPIPGEREARSWDRQNSFWRIHCKQTG